MYYVILAAGVGTRLYPYTKNSPKCLVKVTPTETVIERAVRLISERDENAKFIVALGFCSEQIKDLLGDKCEYVENPFFPVTNSIASLWFVKEKINIDEDLTILNADIVFSRDFADELVKSPDNPCVYFDSSIKSQGDYNVQAIGNKMIVMGKELTTYDGEYVGISKFPVKSLSVFFGEIDHMINDLLYDQWYENALVQLSLNETMTIEAKDASDYNWSEIDSIDNLLKIREIIAKERR